MTAPTIRHYAGQRYELVGAVPYTRKDGSETQLLNWVSACVSCGATFTVSTPAAATRFGPNRRCQKHKRPGQRVKAVQS